MAICPNCKKKVPFTKIIKLNNLNCMICDDCRCILKLNKNSSTLILISYFAISVCPLIFTKDMIFMKSWVLAWLFPMAIIYLILIKLDVKE